VKAGQPPKPAVEWEFRFLLASQLIRRTQKEPAMFHRIFTSLRLFGASFALLALVRTAIVDAQEFQFDRFPDLEKECLQVLGDDEKARMLVARIESNYDEDELPEAVQMLCSILLQGGNMGIGTGWFHPASQLYDWDWLASQQKIGVAERLTEKTFQGDSDAFQRLDRNSDGELNEMDLDWSKDSLYMREQVAASMFFRELDQDKDLKLSRDEMMDFFDRARKSEATVDLDSFRRALRLGSNTGQYFPGDEPTPERLVRGFFNGEVGSMQEGIRAGEQAPDFELATQDGSKKIHLRDWIGEKPIVLVFGNLTCGPFRRNYPDFDAIGKRYQDKAHFFGVYVREAHPSDGWIMDSNTKAGVRLPQPKSIEERTSVAQRCSTELNYSMPLLVDGIDDRVGNLYSGMPARAYVIGLDGIVTYQSGRGPFGFKPGEMEQSLIMTLIASEKP
jgi:hypothetical protein